MYIVTIDGQFFFGTGKYDRPGYELINPQVYVYNVSFTSVL